MWFSKNSDDIIGSDAYDPELDRAWVPEDKSKKIYARFVPEHIRTRIDDVEDRLKGGFTPTKLIDYFSPDSDPNLEYMENEPDELTMKRYTHNRKKVYMWDQVAILFGSLATACVGILAGLNADGALQLLNQVGVSAVSTSTGAAGLLLGGATVFAGVGFVANYFSFRTDIKNDVDLEELTAKRIGRHVAKSIEGDTPERAEEVEARLDLIEQKRLQDYTRNRPTENVSVLHGLHHDAAAQPKALISSEEALLQKLIEHEALSR